METALRSTTDHLLGALRDGWLQFVEQVPAILLAILIIAAGLLIADRLSRLGRRVIAQRTEDPLMTGFLTKTIKLVLGTLVVLFALRVAGLHSIATGLFAAAGAGAIVIGFAFRDIGENFISGIILAFNRPFHVDDTVGIGNIFGKVKAMEFRYTKLKTFDGRDVYIPNSDVIKKAVFNYTEDGYFRLEFGVGLAYEDTLEDARQLIINTVLACDGVYTDADREVLVDVDELAVSTVNVKVRFWVETLDYRKRAMQIKGRVITAVKEALEAKGFSLPADIKEIKLYGSQTSIPVIVRKEGEQP